MREKENLTLLGNHQTEYSMDYNPSVLEAFQNKHPENDYFVKFNCPEFTSLCPITGQPDFATITISYVPDERLVESKSLKLYLFSFRNHGDFHEDVINIIWSSFSNRNILKSGENSFREGDCPLIRIVITESRGQIGSRLPGIV